MDLQGSQSVFIQGSQPPPLQVTSTPPIGSVGVAYTYNFTLIGGTPPYTVTFTNLPAGLAQTGPQTISGTPTGTGGAFNFNYDIKDSGL